MSLLSEWQDRANAERSPKEQGEFWKQYFAAEKENYKTLLGTPETCVSGPFSQLAEKFGMDEPAFMGFLDGINSSLKKEYALDEIGPESEISLALDFEKLYYNMLDCKADWLYTLPEWDGILSQEKRREITKAFRTAKMFVKEEAIGRNDPCPCGSGKKYKKCCGKDK